MAQNFWFIVLEKGPGQFAFLTITLNYPDTTGQGCTPQNTLP